MYFLMRLKTEDPLLQIMKQHENRNNTYSIKKETTRFRNELGFPDTLPTEDETIIICVKLVDKTEGKTGWLTATALKTLVEEDNTIHGKYEKRAKEARVDQPKTHQWLRRED